MPFLRAQPFSIFPDPDNLERDPVFQKYYRFANLKFIPGSLLVYETTFGGRHGAQAAELLDWSSFGLDGLALCSRDIRPLQELPVFYTNIVQVPVTNLVAKPEALAAIDATGSVVNTFMPGIGSIFALALGGLYHGYRQIRNRKVNEALVQGVETARAVLTTTPQGQAADDALVAWLKAHQREAGVLGAVSGLVEATADNAAAQVAAAEIRARVQRAAAG